MSYYFLQILNIDALIQCLLKTLNSLEICYTSKIKIYLHDRIGNCVFSNYMWLETILVFVKYNCR